MSDHPPTGMPENQGHPEDQPERKPLFDPYTGERLQPEIDQAQAHRSEPEHRDAAPAATEAYAPSPTSKKRRGKTLPILVILVVLAISGGVVWYVTGPRADAQAKDKARADAAAAKKAEAKRRTTCETLLNDTYIALRSIDSRLNVGMVERDYTEAVGNARSDYDQIDPTKVEKNKCASFKNLAAAISKYTAASSYWNECITSDYCTPDESKLQGYWGDVTVTLNAVKTNGLGAKTNTPGQQS